MGSSKQPNYYYPSKQIVKREALEDDQQFDDSLLLSWKLNSGDEQSYYSCDQSTELYNFDNHFSLCPVKQDPKYSGADDEVHQVKAENFALKEEEIDIEEHKPRWELLKRSSGNGNVEMFNGELGQAESVVMYRPTKYNCAHCAYKTNQRSNFIRHYNAKHNQCPLIYKCNECSLETKRKSALTYHHQIKHSEDAELYKCQECSYETRYKKSL